MSWVPSLCTVPPEIKITGLDIGYMQADKADEQTIIDAELEYLRNKAYRLNRIPGAWHRGKSRRNNIMSTGNFENWAGEIAEIGAIYSFVGSEVMLAIAGVIFWLWWHVKQAKIEETQLKEEVQKFGDKESLARIVSEEEPEDR